MFFGSAIVGVSRPFVNGHRYVYIYPKPFKASEKEGLMLNCNPRPRLVRLCKLKTHKKGLGFKAYRVEGLGFGVYRVLGGVTKMVWP